MSHPCKAIMKVRRFQSGDEPALLAVFVSAVHHLASRDYTQAQIHAWAPTDLDQAAWFARVRQNRPWVVDTDTGLAGFADLQPTGHIDQFYVCAAHARQGVGTRLMAHLHQQARRLHLPQLTAHVSRTAQPFFERHGFHVIEYQHPIRHGIVIPNASMHKSLP